MQKKLEKYIESLGAIPVDHWSYTHQIKTRIGMLYLKVDTEGKTFALFGNFIDNTEAARIQLGHWKYNLHLWRSDLNTTKEAIKLHLNYVVA